MFLNQQHQFQPRVHSLARLTGQSVTEFLWATSYIVSKEAAHQSPSNMLMGMDLSPFTHMPTGNFCCHNAPLLPMLLI